METRANHVLIGAFTLAVAGFALVFGLWASKYTSDNAWRDYQVRFSEAVTGLSIGGMVQYNGIQIGNVTSLTLAPEDPRIVVARIRIRAETPVREDTVARLALTGLTGIAFIQLGGGSPDSPPLTAREGQELPLIRSEESALSKLMSSSEDIATTASEVLLRVRNLLSDENAARIGRTLANVDALSEAIAGQREDIADTIAHARLASERLSRLLAQAETTLARIETSVGTVDGSLIAALPELTDDLRATLDRMHSLSQRADRMLAENEDALASFGNEGLSQLGPTLVELRQLIRDLGRIGARLETDPSGFLLGGDQPKEYRPK
ncbi:MAG TPA: MCE family protein [Xanthomonadales bacterium]|nr:MCE family protein [Xanthomonadales bacterium]